jgi:phosphatidylglycerol lysyltransferase
VLPEHDVARVLDLLKRYGHQEPSFQLLEPGLDYWFLDDEACVAYCDVQGAWVSAGEPVCVESRLPEVTQAFMRAAAAAGRRVRFFHVSEAFCGVTGLRGTHIGEQAAWDPREWEKTLAGSRSLREQLRRARAKGVSVRHVPGSEMALLDSEVRRACNQVLAHWLEARGMHEMQFMVHVHPFSFPEERRYFVAEQAGKLLAFAVAVPIYARGGWFLEDLIRDQSAPNGTVELLIDRAMRQFAEEGAGYATLGLAPLSGDVNPVLRFTRKHTRRLYNFPGLRAFKEKLCPREWTPVYLAFPRGELGLIAMADVLGAFAPAGLLRFATDSLVHQRTLATFTLALLLVPWTVLLASVHTPTWFPSATVQWAWVGFDVVLIALMASLVLRWRARVAAWLARLTSLDAFLTLAQVLFWNMWTARSLGAWSLLVLGCTGPLLASLFFRRARLLAL